MRKSLIGGILRKLGAIIALDVKKEVPMATIDYVNALNAGAGFDTKALVSALVEAERAPKKGQIDSKMEAAELELSGIGKAVSALGSLDNQLLKLNDAVDFSNINVANTQTTALTITANSLAKEAVHAVTVNSIAAERREISGSFTSADTAINGGNAFDLTIAIGASNPTSTTVRVTSATPTGVVNAINDANLDVTAELLQTGTDGTYKIQLVGKTGSANTFSVTAPPSDLSFTSLQSASDASIIVDSVTFTRASNTFNDVITGATIALHTATSGAANVTFNNDKSALKDELKSFVTTANETLTTLKSLTDRASGGELAGNTVARQIERQIKDTLTGISSTPGNSITRLSDIGIRITKTGVLELDETTLDTALAANYEDIVTMFSADTNAQTNAGDANRGIAGDLSKYIKDLSSSTGYFTTRINTVNDNVTKFGEDLTALESKLLRLEQRYTAQFAAMARVVNEMNTLGDSLTSTFENLPYNNRD